jgi:hypothetical protein
MSKVYRDATEKAPKPRRKASSKDIKKYQQIAKILFRQFRQLTSCKNEPTNRVQ